MLKSFYKLLSQVLGGPTGRVLFFILFYFYLWLAVDLRLIYHGGGTAANFPVFYMGWDFFREFLSSPGGSAEYLSAFLAQFFSIGWAGALIATVQAWLLWLCCRSILKTASGRPLEWLCFLLPVLLLGAYTRYLYPFGVAMELLVVLGFVRLYMAITSKKRPTDLLVFLSLLMILYVIGGSGYLLLAAVCGIYELLLRRRPGLGLLLLFTAPAIVHIEGIIVFNFRVIHLFDRFMPHFYKDNKDMLILVYWLYSLLPAALVLLWLAKLLLKGKGTARPGRPVTHTGKAGAALSLSFGIIMGVAVACSRYNTGLKTQIAVNYYSCNGMWNKALDVSVHYPHSKLVNHEVNRALYHTDQLTQDMFVFPQQRDGLMLSGETENPPAWWRLFGTYIDLGHINLAECMLVMLMDAYGERPLFLKRLALINMVKGNTGMARVYLGVLSKTFFDKDWAKSYLEKIEHDPKLLKEEQIQHLRSIMPETDREFIALNENIFLDLLDKNKTNRMAFEYMAAFYLSINQLDKFVETLSHLDDFNYDKLPRVYEEAVLLYRFAGKKVKLGNRQISPESQQRFKQFCNVYINQYGKNRKAAFSKLAEDYGDSYLFYSLYGRSGMKK